MSSSHAVGTMPKTAWIYPFIGIVFYGAASALGMSDTFTPDAIGTVLAVLLIPVLFIAVFASVYHAEVIAHRTGEPFGTLILSAAVTIIEVALIVSVMLADSGGSPTLARDTVFSVVMTVCGGMTGLCILVGGLRYREQSFRVTGASAYLAVLLVLATLTLILPNYTKEAWGPVYSNSQLAFVSFMTLVLYCVFLYIQTVRHRDFFVMRGDGGKEESAHTVPASQVLISVILLLVALTAVVLLSKKFAAVTEVARMAVGAPAPVTGLLVAIVILLPEGIAAVQAARQDQLQKSINLALGSSLATIGMTFPAIAVVTLYLDKSLVLGLDAANSVLLALMLLVSILTFGTGRTNVLHGFVHLVVFFTFLFLTLQP